MLPLRVEGTNFVDSSGQRIFLRGINLSGDAKFPRKPDVPSHISEHFWNGRDISFVGRPFPVDEADEHLSRIVSWGFNVVRFVITWEAIEHQGPGQYDEEYLEYVISILRKCGQHGLYVLMDPHQDVWSRFSGGSGAPYWTFNAVGMNPRAFQATEAALVHNACSSPKEFPKMIWSTNYERMAAATMFVLFFAGSHFAPKAVINGQNIEDFLQDHFVGAMRHAALRIVNAEDLHETVVIGWESMNEPSQSWIGNSNLSVIPEDQHLRKGTCPTPFQAIATASGLPQEIQTWEFGTTGPKKSGSTLIDPAGTSVWIDNEFDDSLFGWNRDPGWKKGQCIWEQHGLWDSNRNSLLEPGYFAKGPDGLHIDTPAFLQHFWLPHFRRFKVAIREVHASAIIFCQPPVLKVPPIFSSQDKTDMQMVYAPHYYDGLTLMNKSWNTWYNVDVLGILRGQYKYPIFAVRLGLKAIRKCIRDQLITIKMEGLANMGQYPCFFTEIGIPFDMDNKRAYIDGNYSSQIGALDANMFALEGALAHFTLWHYSPLNTNEWGDHWNGEDLSLSSRLLPMKSETDTLLPASDLSTWEYSARAAIAFVRPAPIRLSGDLVSATYDLKSQSFELSMTCSAVLDLGQNCSAIFVPHGPLASALISVSAGHIEKDLEEQLILWWHERSSAGRQIHLKISPV